MGVNRESGVQPGCHHSHCGGEALHAGSWETHTRGDVGSPTPGKSWPSAPPLHFPSTSLPLVHFWKHQPVWMTVNKQEPWALGLSTFHFSSAQEPGANVSARPVNYLWARWLWGSLWFPLRQRSGGLSRLPVSPKSPRLPGGGSLLCLPPARLALWPPLFDFQGKIKQQKLIFFLCVWVNFRQLLCWYFATETWSKARCIRLLQFCSREDSHFCVRGK